MVLWSSWLDGAHAGNLPPIITNSTYTSTDDILLAAGTTLIRLPTPSIHTCYNYVNRFRCRTNVGGVFPCASGVDLGDAITDCTGTISFSSTHTISHTIPHTASVSEATRSLTHVPTSTHSASVSASESSSPTRSLTLTQPATNSATISHSLSLITTYSITTTHSITATHFITTTHAISATATPSPPSTTVSTTISSSESSKCGLLNTATSPSPLMCVRHPNTDTTYSPCSSLSSNNASTSMISDSDDDASEHYGPTTPWRMGATSPMSQMWLPGVWTSGNSTAFSLQIDQPLSLTEDITRYGPNAARDDDFPQLIDVTQWMGSVQRRGPFRMLISITMYFFIVDPDATYTPATLKPNKTDTHTKSTKRKLLAHLLQARFQRIGILARFSGSVDDVRRLGDTIYSFQVPIEVIQCGGELQHNHRRLIQETTHNNVVSAQGVGENITLSLSSQLTAQFSYVTPPQELGSIIDAADSVSQVTNVMGTVVSIVGMMPSAMFAMGVQNSIKTIAQCEGFWVSIQVEEPARVEYQVADLDAMVENDFDFLSSPMGLTLKTFFSPNAMWSGKEPISELALEARPVAVHCLSPWPTHEGCNGLDCYFTDLVYCGSFHCRGDNLESATDDGDGYEIEAS